MSKYSRRGLYVGVVVGFALSYIGAKNYDACILPINYSCSFVRDVFGYTFAVVFLWIKPVAHNLFANRQDLFITEAFVSYALASLIFIILFALLGTIIGDLYRKLRNK